MKTHYLPLAVFGALLTLSTNASSITSAPADPKKPACCTKELAPAAPLTQKSIYQVDSVWTNDASEQIKLTSLRGRPQVVAMFFANCEVACPVLVHDIKRIEAALPATVRNAVGFTLISFDTERDTPVALAAYRKKQSLGANWTLLRGKADDVLEISALLGVKYKKDARGQFSHSNIITVLNAEGEIVHQQIGLNGDISSTVEQIIRAQAAATALKVSAR